MEFEHGNAICYSGYREEQSPLTRTFPSYEQIRELAVIAGDGQKGESLIREIEETTRPRPRDTQRREVATLLWQPGEIVPGQQTLISEMMARNGFVSQSAAMGLSQADHVSLEYIVANPPELLLIAGGSAGQAHPLLNQLDATQVERLDPRLLFCGARTLIDIQNRFDEIRGGLGE